MRSTNKTQYLALQLSFELLGLTGAWYLTFVLRLFLDPIMVRQLTRSQLEMAAPPLSGILCLWLLTAFWVRDRWRRSETLTSTLLGTVESVMVAGAITIVVTFFSRGIG